MNRPQTIQIFLPDGSPRSIKIAEITSRVVKAILIPRNKLDYIYKRDEMQNVGVYFLFGESIDKAKPIVYIGEAEDCQVRLKDHDRKKEFWNYAVVMVSKINAFTKAHIKYLEHIAIYEAKKVNRFETENQKDSSRPHVTESMEADLLDSFDTIKILLSTLGFPVFERIGRESVPDKEVLTISGRGVTAEGDLIDDGFVVFKDSEVAIDEVDSCSDYLRSIRKNLLKSNILIENGGKYKFAEDYVFGSPSTAAGVVLGRSANGWTYWKNKSGITLSDLRRD